MSRKLLGETFDIHGGGLDLMFPHHENEIAQSECCHGQPMAKYWMHNGLMQASSEVGKVGGRNTRPAEGDLAAQEVGKISKSKGSAPFREMLKQFSGETIRFFLLSTQYRRPDRLQRGAAPRGRDRHGHVLPLLQAVRAGHRREFLRARRRRPRAKQGDFDPGGDPLLADVAEHRNRFLEAMDDDFNTGGGIGDLFDLVRRLNKFVDDEKLERARRADERRERRRHWNHCTRDGGASRVGGHAWACSASREEKQPAGDDDLAGKLMKLLIDLRAEARKKKDFATADRIRNALAEIGVTLEDRPGGTEWSVK